MTNVDQVSMTLGEIKGTVTAIKDNQATVMADIETLKTDVSTIKINCASKGSCQSNWLTNLGEIEIGKKHVTGLVAVILVVVIGLCVLKWGPDLVRAAKVLPTEPINKVVSKGG